MRLLQGNTRARCIHVARAHTIPLLKQRHTLNEANWTPSGGKVHILDFPVSAL